MSADEKSPLDAGQLDFAGYLGLLDPKSKSSAVLKEIAIEKLAALYMESQQVEAAQADELTVARNVIEGQVQIIQRLRDYQRKVMNAAAPEGYAIIDEAFRRRLRGPLESGDQREVGMVDRCLARLRLVKPGCCPSCHAAIGTRHAFDCFAQQLEPVRPEGA